MSVFDNVLRQLLVRKLYIAGTSGQFINKRLEHRTTFIDTDRQFMGTIKDQKGIEQGGVNSDHYYKIHAKDQLV